MEMSTFFKEENRNQVDLPRPTCSLFLDTPFTPSGLPKNLNLKPFDAADIEGQKESLITYCIASPFTLNPRSDLTTVVPCDMCTYGYSDDFSSLTCNKAPLCKSKENCSECQFTPEVPGLLVSCDVCIDTQCGMNGNCQCLW
jgi:hypothetical protein